jgi:hypothetical protein
MKAITLYNPHATLMAIGAKMIETRPKKWKHTGLVAIHAGLSSKWLHLCREEPFKSVLAAAGYHSDTQLPFGAVIAVGNVIDCVRTESMVRKGGDGRGGYENGHAKLYPKEEAFGDYSPGRFGYIFNEIRKLKEPIPYKGHQGYWDLPTEWCDGCDGTGLMEGWNHRDGYPCPKCHGNAIVMPRQPKVKTALV